MSDLGRGVAEAQARMLAMLVIIVVLLTSLAWWGFPHVWDWLRPLLLRALQ